MARLMLVEDDPRLAALISEYLVRYDFTVDVVERGDHALERFHALAPDIVVLDLMLPGMDGMSVCNRLRGISAVPILILTAREDAFDEVSCLEQGADDYVNKPVQPRILLARLRTLLRRAQVQPQGPSHEDRELRFGALCIRRGDREVYWGAQQVALNNADHKLLLLLAETAGQVLTRNAILVRMRGIEFDGLDRSIDNSISRLRRKFDDAAAEKIKTVWGEGYLFSPSAW